MMEPPKPAREAERVRRLQGLGILDTDPEERFDRVTRIVKQCLGVPIALVSLVDEERQWFKSKVGLDASETPREISFCGHSILGDVPFVVPDASRDSRFLDNPLVVGAPEIRFYAGVPLASPEGLNVGTLCAISPLPRELSPVEMKLMQDLAALVERELFFADIARAQASVIAAGEAKTAFLANMAHEIRTPVNAVVGAAELIKTESLDDENADLVATIRAGGESLRDLVNGILDYSKIEAGMLELEDVAFSLDALLHDVIRLVAPGASAKRLALALDLGDATKLGDVLGDRARLRQVLVNLLQNAVKFTDTGRVTLRACRDAVDSTGEEVRFEVADTGIGIPADRLEQVFEEYTQAEVSTSRRFGGTGLGLAISRRLVDLMGGELRAQSQVGAGSCFGFTLTMPLAEVVVQAPETSATSARALRILLADDTVANHRVAAAQARRLGHELTAVDSGAAALEHLAADGASYDLVLMDLNMPEMDGVETTRALRARTPDQGGALPVVAMTASALAEDRERCTEAGMNGFLPKPVRLRDLEACLAKLEMPCPRA